MKVSLISRFHRITRDGRYIPEIDGLRFLAIAAVILLHGSEELLDRMTPPIVVQPRYHALVAAIRHGALGVSFFFVISGMVLALPFARFHLQGGQPVSIRKYLARRLTRLEPPYILALVLYSVELYFAKRNFPAGYFREALASLFYQHNLIYGSISPANGVSWSLEIEVQFYLLAPLFMLIFAVGSKWRRRAVLFAAVLGFSVLQMALPATGRVGLSLVGNLQYFLAGLVMADLYLVDLPRWKSSYGWDGAALAVLAFAALAPATPQSHAVLPFAFIMLSVAAFKGPVLQDLLSRRWIAIAGGMCYSLYLLHFSILSAAFKVSKHLLVFHDFLLNLSLQLFLFAIPVAVVSALFFVLVERPCMNPNWPSQLWNWISHARQAHATALDSGEGSTVS